LPSLAKVERARAALPPTALFEKNLLQDETTRELILKTMDDKKTTEAAKDLTVVANTAKEAIGIVGFRFDEKVLKQLKTEVRHKKMCQGVAYVLSELKPDQLPEDAEPARVAEHARNILSRLQANITSPLTLHLENCSHDDVVMCVTANKMLICRPRACVVINTAATTALPPPASLTNAPLPYFPPLPPRRNSSRLRRRRASARTAPWTSPSF
jgi:hypothetical protein